MLVLSRKIGETIRIGDEIEVTIVDVHGSRVRVGVSCPREVTIVRSELVADADVPAAVGGLQEIELQLV